MMYPHFSICRKKKVSSFGCPPLLTGGQSLQSEVKKLEIVHARNNQSQENCNALVLHKSAENLFVIDWLTVVFKHLSKDEVIDLLQIRDAEWTTERKFRNGYPMMTYYSDITISWGADDELYYSSTIKNDGTYRRAGDKIRLDMGVCLNLSGQGCRCFEEFSSLSWSYLILALVRYKDAVSITRLDLAYDDHAGVLDLWRIHNDVKDRNFIGPAKKTMITWSDNLETDIQGCTIEIGSRSSEILIRIYDKSAERGYGADDKYKNHWIRVELQLRRDRAQQAVYELYKLTFDTLVVDNLHTRLVSDPERGVGLVVSGILRNYCMFVVPTSDSNKSRWPFAEYWLRMLESMERIRLWSAVGVEYNFSKAENHLVDQYSQMLCTYSLIHGSLSDLQLRCFASFDLDKLKPKYRDAISRAKSIKATQLQERRCLDEQIKQLQHDLGFGSKLPEGLDDDINGFRQFVFADLMKDGLV